MARSRTARSQSRPKVDPVMAEWERELLRPPSAVELRLRNLRSRLRSTGSSIPFIPTGRKGKTAKDAELQRSRADSHKQGKLTATGKPRKSRRALKRELHSH
jgi:hypothetical protein